MEVTSEMVETALAVFLGEKPENIGQIDRAMNKALVAVLEIVERERIFHSMCTVDTGCECVKKECAA